MGPFVSTQELLPGGFRVFGLAGKHPPAEPGEKGLGIPGGLQSLTGIPLCPPGWAVPGGIPPHRWDCTGNVPVVSPELDFPANPALSLSQLLQKMGDSGSMV